MKLLDRYVLRSFFTAWLAAFVFFQGMYLVIHFFNKLGDLSQATEAFRAQGWSSVGGLLYYYGLNLPFVMVETAPFTILMGAMWTVQQMARKNELVPVLVGGISFKRLALPLLLAGFVLALGFAAIKEEVLPALAPERHRVERIFRGKSQDIVRPAAIKDGRGNTINMAGGYDIQSKTARSIVIFGPFDEAAKRIEVSSLSFEDGAWKAPAGETSQRLMDFLGETDLHPRDIEIESRSLLYLDVTDLRRMISRLPGRLDLQVLLHGHFAYPLATLVLLFMGIPLVLKGTKKSPFVAAGVSLILSILFFAAKQIMAELGGNDELLNPILGAWLPIILFGAVGALLFETMPT